MLALVDQRQFGQRQRPIKRQVADGLTALNHCMSSRFSPPLSVASGRHAGLSLEQLRKVIGVLKTKSAGNLLHGKVGVPQHVAGPANLQLQMVLVGRQSRLLLENVEKLRAPEHRGRRSSPQSPAGCRDPRPTSTWLCESCPWSAADGAGNWRSQPRARISKACAARICCNPAGSIRKSSSMRLKAERIESSNPIRNMGRCGETNSDSPGSRRSHRENGPNKLPSRSSYWRDSDAIGRETKG